MAPYTWYDTPDGEDWARKTEYVLRKTFPVAGCLAVADATQFALAKSFFGMTERFIRVFSAPFLLAATFSTTVYICTNVRKKDVASNHALGVFASTYVLSRLNRNTLFIWTWSFPIALIAYIYKDMKLQFPDAVFHPDDVGIRGNIANEMDYHRPSGWRNPNSFIRWFDRHVLD